MHETEGVFYFLFVNHLLSFKLVRQSCKIKPKCTKIKHFISMSPLNVTDLLYSYPSKLTGHIIFI